MVEFEPKIEQKLPDDSKEFPLWVINSEVYEYLNLSQKDIALGALKVNNIMNYCDLYYVKEDQFKNIIIQNNLVNYYKEITWESISHISKKWIKKFAIKIGIEIKDRYKIQSYIIGELKKKGITVMNELIFIHVSNFIKYFKNDNTFRYYFRKIHKKSFVHMDFDDYKKLWKDMNLKEINIDELKIDIIKNLKLHNIIYLEDLEKITVEKYRDIVKSNPKLEYYFFVTFNLKPWEIDILHIDFFWNDVWLKNKKILEKEKIKKIELYLKTNGINDFDDLINKHVVREVRELLWNHDLSREILNSFWLQEAKDFRKSYIIRFAKRIGLDWLYEEVEYNEENAKDIFVTTLSNRWINCLYWINLLWVKDFKELFSGSRIWLESNKLVNGLLKKYINKTLFYVIPEDLHKIWLALWLDYLSENEYKKIFESFLKLKNISILELKYSDIRKNPDIWNNIGFLFLLGKSWWPNHLRDLRKEHIEELKVYLEKI